MSCSRTLQHARVPCGYGTTTYPHELQPIPNIHIYIYMMEHFWCESWTIMDIYSDIGDGLLHGTFGAALTSAPLNWLTQVNSYSLKQKKLFWKKRGTFDFILVFSFDVCHVQQINSPSKKTCLNSTHWSCLYVWQSINVLLSKRLLWRLRLFLTEAVSAVSCDAEEMMQEHVFSVDADSIKRSHWDSQIAKHNNCKRMFHSQQFSRQPVHTDKITYV